MGTAVSYVDRDKDLDQVLDIDADTEIDNTYLYIYIDTYIYMYLYTHYIYNVYIDCLTVLRPFTVLELGTPHDPTVLMDREQRRS